MQTKDLPLAIEALAYDKESINIRKHTKCVTHVMRDTFFRISLKNTDGVGSMFEGLGSADYCFNEVKLVDQDVVKYLTEIRMGSQCISEILNVEKDLRIISCTNFPGYVYIKPLEPSLGSNYIKHFINKNDKTLRPRKDEIPYFSVDINGPALTECTGEGKTDYVDVLKFKSWPLEASKWERRTKPNKWPPKELIDKIKSEGFTLAQVAHHDCSEEERNVQWRIGIVGEHALISNLNETQMLCYVALRMISKGDKQLIDGNVLSSFEMKNIIFWCIEQESCQWTKENFEVCLKTCIERLIRYITSGHFPHYFIEDRNLINSKMTDEVKERIVKTLTKYSNNILALTSLSEFDELKRSTNFQPEAIECAKQKSIIVTCIMFYNIPFLPFYLGPHHLWQTYVGHSTANSLDNAKNILTILRKSKWHYLRHHIAYAKNMLGLLHYSRYMYNKKHKDKLEANELLRSSLTFQNISLKFRVATFYFMEHDFDDCLSICFDFLENPCKYKTLLDKFENVQRVFSSIIKLISIRINIVKPYENIKDKNCAFNHLRENGPAMTELKENILSIFNDNCISEEYKDGNHLQAEAILSDITKISNQTQITTCRYTKNDMSELLFMYLIHKSNYAPLLVFENCANLIFREMSFNVPYLASEKWAVPDAFQYELLSVQSRHPESSLYGIYIDPMLNCLVLSFLCYTNTKNLTQRDEMLNKMATYVTEYPYNDQTVAAELPHSLPLYKVYNIVAYCFVKAGRYKQALKYLLTSFDLHGKTDNVAYGYIRCVRLYVQEYIVRISLEDVHDYRSRTNLLLTEELIPSNNDTLGYYRQFNILASCIPR